MKDDSAIHPGEHLREELAALDMSAADLRGNSQCLRTGLPNC